MACISVSGTGFAARIRVWAAGRARTIPLCAAAPLLLAGNSAPLIQNPVAATPAIAEPALTVSFVGLRSAKGLVRGCLTRNPAFFPSCDKDPHSLKASIPAGPDARMHFTAIAPGDYALSILHDENANARLDVMLGIPKEGVGFSQNPRLRFSAPKFDAVRFHMGSADISKEVQIKYFL